MMIPPTSPRVRRLLVAAALAALASSPGQQAAAQHYNVVHDKGCDGVEGAGDAGVRACYWRLSNATDTAEQTLYARILRVVSASNATALKGQEQQWSRYRSAFCSAEHGLFDGGTAGLSAEPTCRLALTREHVADLQDGFGWLLAKFGG